MATLGNERVSLIGTVVIPYRRGETEQSMKSQSGHQSTTLRKHSQQSLSRATPTTAKTPPLSETIFEMLDCATIERI